MTTDTYARMSADAATYWEQTQDWREVVYALANDPSLVGPDAVEIVELKLLCREIERLKAPTDEHLTRISRLQKAINPTPPPDVLGPVGGADYEGIMDEIVRQHGGRREAKNLRRAALAYRYFSLLLDGLQRRRKWVGAPMEGN